MPSRKRPHSATKNSNTVAPIRAIKKPRRAHRYRIERDRTLTSSQQTLRGFVDVNAALTGRLSKKNYFRVPSNPTVHSFSSGYHEAGLTTDSANHLTARLHRQKGISQFRSNAPEPLRNKKFYEANVSTVMHAGDGLRTDTAQTVLSVPRWDGGGGAGHSGSGVKQSGQKSAHDLLRESTVELLQNKNLTSGIAAVAFGAFAVASMAPGEVASKTPNIRKLKAQHVRDHWEQNREEVKARVEDQYQRLSTNEQQEVDTHMQSFFQKLPKNRRLANGRCTSPVRDTRRQHKNAVSGGGYVSKKNDILPEPRKKRSAIHSDQDAREATSYFTQPFRSNRS